MKKLLLILSLLTSVANAAEVSSLKDLPKFSFFDNVGNTIKNTLLGSYESRLIERFEQDVKRLNLSIEESYRDLKRADDRAELQIKLWYKQCIDKILLERKFSNIRYIQKDENIYQYCEDIFTYTTIDNKKISDEWKFHIKQKANKALADLNKQYNDYLNHYKVTGKETETERFKIISFYTYD